MKKDDEMTLEEFFDQYDLLLLGSNIAKTQNEVYSTIENPEFWKTARWQLPVFDDKNGLHN